MLGLSELFALLYKHIIKLTYFFKKANYINVRLQIKQFKLSKFPLQASFSTYSEYFKFFSKQLSKEKNFRT